MDRGHLIGDRTDAADARHDVHDLVRSVPTTALEVARRLEDLQMGLRHLPVTNRERQPALALDSRQLADVDLDLIGLGIGSVLTVARRPRGPRACGTAEPTR